METSWADWPITCAFRFYVWWKLVFHDCFLCTYIVCELSLVLLRTTDFSVSFNLRTNAQNCSEKLDTVDCPLPILCISEPFSVPLYISCVVAKHFQFRSSFEGQKGVPQGLIARRAEPTIKTALIENENRAIYMYAYCMYVCMYVRAQDWEGTQKIQKLLSRRRRPKLGYKDVAGTKLWVATYIEVLN